MPGAFAPRHGDEHVPVFSRSGASRTTSTQAACVVSQPSPRTGSAPWASVPVPASLPSRHLCGCVSAAPLRLGVSPFLGLQPTLPALPEAKGHNSEPNLRPAMSSCAWTARVVPKSSGAGKGGAREWQGSVQDPSTWDKGCAKRCHVQVCEAGIRGWGGQQLARPRAQLTGRLIALLDAVGTGLPRRHAA